MRRARRPPARRRAARREADALLLQEGTHLQRARRPELRAPGPRLHGEPRDAARGRRRGVARVPLRGRHERGLPRAAAHARTAAARAGRGVVHGPRGDVDAVPLLRHVPRVRLRHERFERRLPRGASRGVAPALDARRGMPSVRRPATGTGSTTCSRWCRRSRSCRCSWAARARGRRARSSRACGGRRSLSGCSSRSSTRGGRRERSFLDARRGGASYRWNVACTVGPILGAFAYCLWWCRTRAPPGHSSLRRPTRIDASTRAEGGRL